jgi:hypothetical protein
LPTLRRPQENVVNAIKDYWSIEFLFSFSIFGSDGGPEVQGLDQGDFGCDLPLVIFPPFILVCFVSA